MNLKRDIELLFEISSYRFVQRTWKRFLNPDVANCAEHTLHVAWTALTIAKYEKKGNHEKILKMAMIHDLPESRTGDVDYLSRQYTKRNEKQAGIDIFSGTIHEEAIELLEEYEKRESVESRIVKDADLINCEFELAEQQSCGHDIGTVWNKDRRKNVYSRLYTKTAKTFWNAIHKTSPHGWHLNARNRFVAGDWKK